MSIQPHQTSKLFGPVNNVALTIFRVLFGFIMSFDCLLHIFKGWVYTMFTRPSFHFSYIGLEFLEPLPGNAMIYYFLLMALMAVMVMVGWFYRVAIISFTILFTGSFLMEKSFYNNHNYLIILLCLLLCIAPANRGYSMDVKRGAVNRKETVEAWVPLIFIIQIAIVYFFGAVNKIYPDWLSGRFISIALASKHQLPLVGGLFQQHWFHIFIAYSGLLFDLLIVPLLLWGKTRRVAIVLSILFHLFNSFSFNIGIFPFLALSLLVFFIPAGKIQPWPGYQLPAQTLKIVPFKRERAVVAFFFCYVVLQVLIPLRHWAYPGDVNWTGEGDRFSWRMMLKNTRGEIVYKIVGNEPGAQILFNPQTRLTKYQYQMLVQSPDMIWQYAQFLKQKAIENGVHAPKVYAHTTISLNLHPYRQLIDSTIDLGNTQWKCYSHAEWIISN